VIALDADSIEITIASLSPAPAKAVTAATERTQKSAAEIRNGHVAITPQRGAQPEVAVISSPVAFDSMRVVTIVGGFERSGHDAAAAALEEACMAAGVHARMFNWREHLDLDELLVFHLHRVGMRAGLDGLTALAETPAVQEALVRDLAPALPHDLSDSDAVLSVHPWSSMLLDRALGRDLARLIDCHVEFSSFPVRPLVLATWQTGTWAPRPAVPAERVKHRRTGIPVRRAFAARPKSSGTLAVNCGSDGWFAGRALAALPALASAVGATEVVLLAGDRLQADPRDLTRLRADVRVIEGQPDVSAEVSRARYLITKAGGAPVAEAPACGAVPILLSSGVSWEDEALARLVSCGATVNAQSPMLTADLALHGDPSLPATELG
jgi:hypothetical protein